MKKEVSKEKQRQLQIVGQNIKRIRLECGLSQEQLANQCGHTNEHARSWISKIEKGNNDLPTSELKQIAKVLGVTPVDLMRDPEDSDLERKACELFQKCYGKEAFSMVQKFLLLDPEDQKEMCDLMDLKLKKEKYSVKKESSRKQIS